MYKKEDYYCDVRDKTDKVRSKSKHLQSRTHNEVDECIQMKHTVENQNVYGIGEVFTDYITNHYKTFDLYPVKYHSEIIFDGEFYPENKSELRTSQSKLH